MSIDVNDLARELLAAYLAGEPVLIPPSARDPAFDLAAAYAVEAELMRLRRESGRKTVGWKVAYVKRSAWPALKLETVVWAPMYDDTVRDAAGNAASLSVARMVAPRIEPEIVMKLKKPIASTDAAAVLEATDWLALGFEVIDRRYRDADTQPADFVAAFGFHAALVVGEPVRVEPAAIASLVDRLPRFTARLLKNGQPVDDGVGANILGSPALCVAELAAALGRQSGAQRLGAGDLISTGSLTASQPLQPGERWDAEVDGLDLPALTLLAQ